MESGIYWPTFFFLLFAALACGFALAVVMSTNIVRMAFYLVLSLAATAGLFFLAGADFVGAMQIMIYVGGTLVLLIFGVMLTAKSPFISLKTRGGDWIIAAFVGGSLLFLLVSAAFDNEDWGSPSIATVESVEVEPTATKLGLSFLGIRTDGGESGYLLLFEIVAVHLLVVLVGAAYLARPKRRRGAKTDTP